MQWIGDKKGSLKRSKHRKYKITWKNLYFSNDYNKYKLFKFTDQKTLDWTKNIMPSNASNMGGILSRVI